MRRLGILMTAAVLATSLAACSKSETAGEEAAEVVEVRETSDAEKAEILATLPAPYNTADLVNGKRKFAMCKSCHNVVPNGANMTGPNLHGIFGRKAGTVEGFKYSDAMAAAGFTWDTAQMDKWLTNPKMMMPESKMSYAGLDDPKDRTDLIAYLQIESGVKGH